MSGKKAKKRRGFQGSRMAVIFGGVALVYFLAQIIGVLTSGGVETVSASHVTVDDAITATGCFIRDETVIAGARGETVEHVVHSGEKVYTGARLAVEYTSTSALDANRELKQLEEEISLLQSAVQSSGNLSDTAKLDQLITVQMQTLAKQTHDGIVSDLSQDSTSLRQLVLRRGAGGQDVAALEAEIQTLQQRKSTLQASANANINVISSPCEGYFCETVDGYESIFSTADLDTITVSDFTDRLAQKAEPDSAALGKVMQGFSWYFAAAVPNEDAQTMETGRQYLLRFSQISQDVKATLYTSRPETNGTQTLLIFKSNVISSELVSMRQQVVDIIRGSYTGIKVPKTAIRTLDGALGVYTLNGTVSRFKEIKTLFEGDTYFVIEQGNTDQTGVVVQDEIIIKARGLEDKKVVK